MLRVALDALTHVTGHEISSLHLLTPDRTTLHPRGDRGLRPFLREINRVLPVGEGMIGRVVATGRPIHVADSSASPDLLPAARTVVQQEGIHAFACVPIRSRGRILGALSLGRRTLEPFTEPEIALVEAAANQIGLALENAQLYSATRRQLEELRSDLASYDLRRDGVEVVTELGQVPPVSADAAQIQHVLLNLVQNAQQAMATRTGERVLTVRLSAADGRARVEVLDTGPGIPADALPRIFDAFFTTKAPGEGTGLGLWLSYAIVERHEGSLGAANRPGGGAVLTLELPLAEDVVRAGPR